MTSELTVIDSPLPVHDMAVTGQLSSPAGHGSQYVVNPTVHSPVGQAAAVLATAVAAPATTNGEQTEAMVWELARIAHHLGELTATARDRWAAWGTVTPHLQQAQVLAADVARCLAHAADIYAFNTTVATAASPTRRSSGYSL
jgi:hypothetical protein